MDEETIINSYRATRQSLEEQEDELKAARKKGEYLLEDSLQELSYILKDLALDGEPFNQARRKMENENHHFLEELENEKRILKQKEEAAENTYYTQLKKLREETQNIGEET
ncbi:hypothetical protein A5819_003486 [Enterococcus sp. 7E2_DIV0204]|uniref:hypothetical protein n=1 Tax=unclassified Enterococcus TaxID=2608891 RepID=UPI000A341860|nr:MULTISPECIES: hypothetical protein [unclassified Enterococcus]OTN83936.1 hypothetical protein A5819_003486 [Enterococcus sp. 7E2_DIV0204]OTP46844.1 hypothetical protein A5884_003722 [Enterococcus sp. 7D2_DIV0200]